MVRKISLSVAAVALAVSASSALACPFGKSAQTSEQQTTASSQPVLPTAPGTTTGTTPTTTDETKTGG